MNECTVTNCFVKMKRTNSQINYCTSTTLPIDHSIRVGKTYFFVALYIKKIKKCEMYLTYWLTFS